MLNLTNERKKRSVKVSKKTDDLDDDYTIIAIDQTRQEITIDLVHTWFSEEERPTLPVSDARESLKLLGGDIFFLKCEDNFMTDIAIWLLDALQTEFGEKICVVLDNASYFAANDVHDSVEETSVCATFRGVHLS
ncbi:hypothetical protein C444_09807 [Haloarcula japonica DSM 6131]|uniref:Tc1-like transposase DDE domain-containing protein n=1 Tax=Haloarcula japonica (strain ATCC 49778 / DSM 6131 / JCM 7785 / NBRC 101032 / NCIMB 13157 / TR-1) TaxID=1227453 RepID=M0LER4_HALJT|nr:hypothetical protein C444_09807 [Haloarcula japonica DSM 6131]